MTNNTIVQAYTTLKTLFALHYQIEPDLLSWTQLNVFLKSNSFYANEIIFSPVFRSFIAALGRDNGYANDDLWLLRDIQNTEYSPGRYNPLDATEASPLFYTPFGISLALYEYDTSAKDYVMRTSMPCSPTDYPFGRAPTLKLYIKTGVDEASVGHFELQPHETLAEATQAFINDVNALPEELGVIHDGLSSSQRAYDTNRYLGQLVTYVRKTLLNQLTHDRQQPIDARTYSVSGLCFHNPTPSGRQTFALILLIILFETRDPLAQSFLDQMHWLSEQDSDATANELLDDLAENIITSNANLSSGPVIDIYHQITTYQLEVSQALQKNAAIPTAPIEAQLRNAITELQSAATQEPQAHIPLIQSVVQSAGALLTGSPIRKDMTAIKALEKKVQTTTRNWGKTIAGLMLAVIGLAMMLVASLGFAGTLLVGLATPASAAMIAGGAYTTYQGIRFFNAERGNGHSGLPEESTQEKPSPTAE